MHFAGRDLYILFICITHVVVIINSQTAVSKWVILIQISSEDHACILAENLYQRTYDNILVIA